MENSPSLNTVFEALRILYHNSDVTGKEQASAWLGELQRSVYAWQIADQLLHMNKDLESSYFAAQTMRTKIHYAFPELDPSSHESLRNSLLEHLAKLTPETPHVIVTQLCLAFSDLFLQMVSWKGAVDDLLQKFSQSPQHIPFLLDYLIVMPEELNSDSLRLGANRRHEVTDELKASSPNVLRFLNDCSSQYHTSHDIQTKVFHCIRSWCNISALPDDALLHTEHLTRLFQCLVDPNCPAAMHEAAADCICAIFYSCNDISTHNLLIQTLVHSSCHLEDSYHLSVAHENIDKSINFARIFTECAETLLLCFVSTPNHGLGSFQILDLVLTTIGHHQYEVAEISFNFWYRLSEELYQKNDDRTTDYFKPYIQRLIVALCKHCRMDTDSEGIPTDNDDFGDFRIKVSDLVQDVVFIIGSSTVFRQMFENLRSQSADSSWDASESALFIMSAVAKNIMPDEDTIIPQVIPALLSLPPNTHIALRYTSIQLIGQLSEWIDEHQQYLDPALQFLLDGLQQPTLASGAAKSLQGICSMCRDKMTSHMQGLMNIIKSLDSFNLSSEAAIGLLKGTATVLTQLPPPDLTTGLQQICSIQIDGLQKLISVPADAEPNGTPDPIIWLDRLAAIFRHVTPKVPNGQEHPCQKVIQQLWPVLSETCNKYQADARIVERYCRCIRFAVRCVGKASHSLLAPLVTQMVMLYQIHKHSCFLYLGSILVDEYGADAGCTQGLLGMLEALSAPTFTLLEQANGLRQHPDTVDDFFRLCLRFSQRLPGPFLQSSLCNAVLACAISALTIDQRDAHASVTRFLLDFIKLPSSANQIRRQQIGTTDNKTNEDDIKERYALITSYLSNHGPILMLSVINCCIQSLPTYMLADIADIVVELHSLDAQALSKWLETALSQLASDNPQAIAKATPQQIHSFHSSIVSSSDVKNVTTTLRDFARLFR